MSGSQSALIGGGTAPLGATVQFHWTAPSWLNIDGVEYLKQGNIVPYSADYEPIVTLHPSLGVWGNDAAQKGGALTSSMSFSKHFYLNSNYLGVDSNGISYSNDLITWTSCPGTQTLAASHYASASSGSYVVAARQAANNAHIYTDGVTFSAVGGTFSTFPVATAVAFGNDVWVSLSSLKGAAGEQAYIASANPSGTWTVGAGTNFGMTDVRAIAYGAGVFVAAGFGGVANSGKLVTCTTPAGGWTDRTPGMIAALGLSTGSAIGAMIFDGTLFWILAGNGALGKSADGINWTKVKNCPIPIQAHTLVGSGFASDGAGRLVVTTRAVVGNDMFWASTSDGGTTWQCGGIYIGKVLPVDMNQGGISYANGKWLETHTGTCKNPLDLGTLTGTPNYVGGQINVIFSPTNNIPAHIRIK